MGDLAELVLDGPVQLLLPVSVEIYPERGAAVEILPPLGVDEIVALACLDNEGVLLLPPGHLGEGVPDVLPVEPFKSCQFPGSHTV